METTGLLALSPLLTVIATAILVVIVDMIRPGDDRLAGGVGVAGLLLALVLVVVGGTDANPVLGGTYVRDPLTALLDAGPVPPTRETAPQAHQLVDPAILYWGTPVVLVSTLNEDGSANLAPISSAFWLGHTATLGFGLTSHSLANLQRTGECVLNLPGPDQVSAVDRLALTTGADNGRRLQALLQGWCHQASSAQLVVLDASTCKVACSISWSRRRRVPAWARTCWGSAPSTTTRCAVATFMPEVSTHTWRS